MDLPLSLPKEATWLIVSCFILIPFFATNVGQLHIIAWDFFPLQREGHRHGRDCCYKAGSSFFVSDTFSVLLIFFSFFCINAHPSALLCTALFSPLIQPTHRVLLFCIQSFSSVHHFGCLPQLDIIPYHSLRTASLSASSTCSLSSLRLFLFFFFSFLPGLCVQFKLTRYKLVEPCLQSDRQEQEAAAIARNNYPSITTTHNQGPLFLHTPNLFLLIHQHPLHPQQLSTILTFCDCCASPKPLHRSSLITFVFAIQH